MSNKFAENFAALRKEKKMTQAEVAAKLNVSAQAVSKWENGESLPDVSLLSAIADLFDTTIDALFGRQPQVVVETVKPPKGDYSNYFLRVDAVSNDGSKAKINIPLAVAAIMFKAKGSIKIADFTLTETEFASILEMVEAGAVGSFVDAESADGDHARIYIEKIK